MYDGDYPEREACLRMKMDLTSGNPYMWDTIAYRVKKAPHHRTGDKWSASSPERRRALLIRWQRSTPRTTLRTVFAILSKISRRSYILSVGFALTMQSLPLHYRVCASQRVV